MSSTNHKYINKLYTLYTYIYSIHIYSIHIYSIHIHIHIPAIKNFIIIKIIIKCIPPASMLEILYQNFNPINNGELKK